VFAGHEWHEKAAAAKWNVPVSRDALRFRRGNNDVLLQKSPPSGYHARTYLTTPFATLLVYKPADGGKVWLRASPVETNN